MEEALKRKFLKDLKVKDMVLSWGNVLKVFESEKVSSILIDDFSATCNVMAFGEQKRMLEGFEKGDRIQVIGEVKVDKNEEIYILPEIVIKIDAKTELLRRLENLEFLKEPKSQKIEKSQELKVEKNIL